MRRLALLAAASGVAAAGATGATGYCVTDGTHEQALKAHAVVSGWLGTAERYWNRRTAPRGISRGGASWLALRRQLDFERLADSAERFPAEPAREANQPQKHLGGDERVAAGRVPVVRDDVEHAAQGIEREVPDWRAPRECTIPLEVQGEIHRVEAPVQQLQAPVPAVRNVERRDVVTDVMADDHPVAQVVEEQRERLRFLHPLPALVAGDAVHGDGFGVALHPDQCTERILDDDLTVHHRHRTNRH